MEYKDGYLWFSMSEIYAAPGLETVMPERLAEDAIGLVAQGIRNLNEEIDESANPGRLDEVDEIENKKAKRTMLQIAMRKLHRIAYPESVPPTLDEMSAWTSEQFNRALDKALKEELD